MSILYLIIAGILILCLSYNLTKFQRSLRAKEYGNTVKILSNKDGNSYDVQDLPGNDEAADMMADINIWISDLVKSLNKKYPNKSCIKRLLNNYNPNSVIEGNPLNKDNYTSYSINKGQILVFCIRSKKNLKIHPKPLIQFVVMHELAHLASLSLGHNKEFYDNFRLIMKHAIKESLFNVDYFDEQQGRMEYCGMDIPANPIKTVIKD